MNNRTLLYGSDSGEVHNQLLLIFYRSVRFYHLFRKITYFKLIFINGSMWYVIIYLFILFIHKGLIFHRTTSSNMILKPLKHQPILIMTKRICALYQSIVLKLDNIEISFLSAFTSWRKDYLSEWIFSLSKIFDNFINVSFSLATCFLILNEFRMITERDYFRRQKRRTSGLYQISVEKINFLSLWNYKTNNF